MARARWIPRRGLLGVLSAAALLVAFTLGCDASTNTCRFTPERCERGRPGAFCVDRFECMDICCTAVAGCGSGMCTVPCTEDRDCPGGMACERDVCFFACEADEDCAAGQTCEGARVCVWP